MLTISRPLICGVSLAAGLGLGAAEKASAQAAQASMSVSATVMGCSVSVGGAELEEREDLPHSSPVPKIEVVCAGGLVWGATIDDARPFRLPRAALRGDLERADERDRDVAASERPMAGRPGGTIKVVTITY